MISADEVTSNCVTFTQIQSDDFLYFSEARPSEQGRVTLMRYDGVECIELLPPNFSIGSRIHIYGGRSFEVSHQRIFFVNAHDQGIYELKATPEPIFVQEGLKFGDLRFNGKVLFALCEEGEQNRIVKIDLATKEMSHIADGAHFYGSLALHPGGEELAWVEWDHPHMPWDDARIVTTRKTLCAVDQTSAQDPLYLRDGTLLFQWDMSGYWNPYTATDLTHPIIEQNCDFASPMWQFGARQYCELNNQLAFICTDQGLDYITLYDREEMTFERLELPFNCITHITPYRDQLALVAGSSTHPLSLILLNPTTSKYTLIKKSQRLELNTYSIPQPLTIENRYKQEVHSFFYPPNPPVEKPPLIVKCHSGPTSRVTPLLNLSIQYFTSRGFAFLETNYGGSTGYGRAYRNRLIGQWGEVDVTDTIDTVQALIDDEKIDPDHLFITGSSSGGLTTLLALAQTDLFKASVVLYAVTDLIPLLEHTHKFEKHYFDSLIGPYPGAQKLYHTRNPINHLDNIKAPTLIFQGMKDKVVAPSQALHLSKKLSHLATLHTFEEEGHSFKRADSKKSVLEKTLAFYQDHLKK